ncbi:MULTISPECIES: flagellar basal-body MS-ring/collar protein FliF [Gammaproteobacteria]|uniref:Flagellar M-ring protein n=1 Tax=Vreelandella halophila TaxID=86177 RepID=A0A9X4YD29_9GAMM|nr:MULTISPECIES: flagellar basal-body MS-ring/collar protein FliF [Gammaproteobacteria]KAA8984231.1 flagellar basal body M-ring protein FliF [Halospina sp. K52047b]MYL27048.1 flagellar basal body M-ring protein FliF [Halomonas utahensis]MYL75850.1 flagellar basal body M-ring protein FliF [Halomonas sp. 22501_18_FS]
MANVPAETEQTNPPASGGGGGSESSATGGGSNLLMGVNRLTLLRQVGLIVGLAASVALAVALVLWAQGSDYKPLVGDMSEYNPAELTNVLDSAGVDYRIEHRSGALLVASGDIHEARLALAREGVTEDKGMGFEIIMQDQGLGTSQFMEKARFHRSLEGELARTIRAMGNVRNSRVHLAIPEDSVFVSDNRNPSASVMVDLGSGRRMDETQVRSVINLVAGSVPQMSREDVTVVDQRGNHLSANVNNEKAQEMAQKFQMQRRVEQRLKERVAGILAPIMGRDRFNAEVSVDMDFKAVEQAEEIFNPEQQALRSEQTVEEINRQGEAGGIPGALSNQPPGEAEAPEQAGGEGGGEGGGSRSSRTSSTRNYEVDRLLSFTRKEPGSVNRMSVAVAVDDLKRTNPETGETTSVEWPQAELERLTRLVRDAVGFSAARGDSVTVVNTDFAEQQEPEIEPVPFYEQPWFQDSIRPVIAGLVIIALALLLVRPTLKTLASGGGGGGSGEAGESDLEGLGGLDDIEGSESIRSAMGSGDDRLLPDTGESYDRELNAVKGLIAEDPARVAQVVRQWVNADE